MDPVAIGLLLVFSFGLFLLVQKKPPKGRRKRIGGKQAIRNVSDTRDKPYKATLVKPGAAACDAVISVAKTVYLARVESPPILPLSGCDAAQCKCQYVHRDDRRDPESQDRRLPAALKTELYGSDGRQERRKKQRGRRRTDFAIA